LQLVQEAEEWLLSTVTSTQTDAVVSIGPVVQSQDGMLYALHVKQANFHTIKATSVSLEFKNSTWYCEGGVDLTAAAYRAALFNTKDAQSDQAEQGEAQSPRFVPTMGRDAAGNPAIPPPSGNSGASAPSTVLLAAIASGCAGANLHLLN
jgi:hypothetical protein